MNPIEQAIAELIECGWTDREARNLLAALKSDVSPEHLSEIIPKWIAHCGDKKSYVTNLLGLVAAGLVNVYEGEGGGDNWLFRLNAEGRRAGEMLFAEGHA